MLVRRVRNTLNATNLQCIGTSATLSSAGGFEQQRNDVAAVAFQNYLVMRSSPRALLATLRRSTVKMDFNDPAALSKLKDRVTASNHNFSSYHELINDPLASWIESNLGLRTDEQIGWYAPGQTHDGREWRRACAKSS